MDFMDILGSRSKLMILVLPYASLFRSLQHHYRLGIGNLRIDLESLQLPPGETDVDARVGVGNVRVIVPPDVAVRVHANAQIDRKSTRLNSSHVEISYAVFCLKKKTR